MLTHLHDVIAIFKMLKASCWHSMSKCAIFLWRKFFLMVNYIWVPIGMGILAMLFAAYLVFYVLRRDTGTPGMQKIANAIFAGATAFLNRQYRTIALLSIL